ncbi:MAG: ABC transporter permease [Candidatus Kerfeldbacteria bacterium]|nr:ABC transporter permease [Candidatus Kerfeldbacteria bacterium]
MISRQRIQALIIQEWYISKRSLEVIMDLPVFSLVDLLLFGFVSAYLLTGTTTTGNFILLGAMLWEIVRVTQYSMTVSSMWNVWSRNLSNILIAPISLIEYVLASALSAMLKSTVITVGLAVVAYLLFGFSLLQIGFGSLIWYGANLMLFSISVGLLLLGLIFRFGTRIQALGWGLIYICQPLCGIYFPVSVLPQPLQWISYILPPTYVFEAARTSLSGGVVTTQHQVIMVLVNIAGALVCMTIFRYFYHSARTTGQLARLEN